MTHKSNMLKKTAAATLAASLITAGLTGALASAHSKNDDNGKGKGNDKKHDVRVNLDFKDLNQKDYKWAYEHIIRLASQGVFKGDLNGDFKPRDNVKRVDAIVASVRLLGLEAEAEKPENMNADLNFKDFDQVKKKYAYAVGYIKVALEHDLFAETETSIQPEKPASRLWTSILLVKALKLDAEAKAKMGAQLPFKDENEIPAGSVGYVAVALEKGIITGYTTTGGGHTVSQFLPNKPITRAEIATILDRVDTQLPPDQSALAIVGSITAIGGGSVTVKKADNTSVVVPLDANVFIFRHDVKAPVSALQVGDEILLRTFQNKAVFIEVTKESQGAIQFTDAGKVVTFTVNAQGKISSITLVRSVNGTDQQITYVVDANATISGLSGVVAPNSVVVVKGNTNIVTKIEIQS